MKKLAIITAVATVVAAILVATAWMTCEAAPIFGKRVKGSGRIVSRTLPAPAFDAVSASRAVRVVLSATADEILVEADDNLIDLVRVDTEQGTLQVTVDQQVKSLSNPHITVTVPAGEGAIRALKASSSAEIRSEVTLHAETAQLNASSSGEIEADYRAGECSVKASSSGEIRTRIEARGACTLQASSSGEIDAALTAATCDCAASSSGEIDAALNVTDCMADASSSGTIRLSGHSATLEAEASSGADIHAESLTCDRVTAKASSGAGIDVSCRETLRARASSGADIRYTGDCRVEAERSSGGSVRKK